MSNWVKNALIVGCGLVASLAVVIFWPKVKPECFEEDSGEKVVETDNRNVN